MVGRAVGKGWRGERGRGGRASGRAGPLILYQPFDRQRGEQDRAEAGQKSPWARAGGRWQGERGCGVRANGREGRG
jgi:hypothetical protein